MVCGKLSHKMRQNEAENLIRVAPVIGEARRGQPRLAGALAEPRKARQSGFEAAPGAQKEFRSHFIKWETL